MAIADLILLVGAKASAWSQMKNAAVAKINRIFMVVEECFIDFAIGTMGFGQEKDLEGSFRCSKLNSEFEVLEKGIFFGVVFLESRRTYSELLSSAESRGNNNGLEK